MADRPKDMAVLLRQVSSCKGKPASQYPDWFLVEFKKDQDYFSTLMGEAADELETMQKLNGKLYKTLYPS